MSDLIQNVQGIKWVDDETPLNAENMNKIERRIAINDSNIRAVSTDLDNYKKSTEGTLSTLSEVNADKITEWNNKFGPTANYENAQGLVETYQLQADVKATNENSRAYIKNKDLLVTDALETDSSKLSYLKNREALFSDYEAKELLDNGKMNPAYIKNKPEKIGDVRITTRYISDPHWILCDHTKINKNKYPELYPIVSNGTEIFKGKWYSSEVENGGIAPIYSSDGYIYFIKDNATTASRCKPDFTEFETFTVLTPGYIHYENGYWFSFNKISNGPYVYYSSDCFKSDSNSINYSVYNSGYYYPETSYVRYTNGFWCITLDGAGTSKNPLFIYSGSIDGEYQSVTSTTPDGDDFSDSTNNIICDYIVFNNGTKLVMCKGQSSSRVLKCKLKNGSWTILQTLDENNKNTVDIIPISDDGYKRYLTYIKEYDIIYLHGLLGSQITNYYANKMSIVIKNDRTILKLTNLPVGSSGITHQMIYFKNFLYHKIGSSTKIYRLDPNNLQADPEISSEYITTYNISASPDYLYMPIDENNMYYIKDPTDIDIPPAFPDSIYKTYIKCK